MCRINGTNYCLIGFKFFALISQFIASLLALLHGLQHRTLYRIKACNTDLFGSTNFSPRQQRLKDLPTSKLQTKNCRISGVCLGQARAKGVMHFLRTGCVFDTDIPFQTMTFKQHSQSNSNKPIYTTAKHPRGGISPDTAMRCSVCH